MSVLDANMQVDLPTQVSWDVGATPCCGFLRVSEF